MTQRLASSVRAQSGRFFSARRSGTVSVMAQERQKPPVSGSQLQSMSARLRQTGSAATIACATGSKATTTPHLQTRLWK